MEERLQEVCRWSMDLRFWRPQSYKFPSSSSLNLFRLRLSSGPETNIYLIEIKNLHFDVF